MKMNTLTMQQQGYQFEQDLDYEEYLRYSNTEPTSAELDDMEKVYCKSKVLRLCSHNPSNSFDYEPLQPIGA